MSDTRNTQLAKIGLEQARESFIIEHVQQTPEEQLIIEGLGIAIARWSEWTGLTIMQVFYAALEEANYHQEAGLVQEMIDKESTEDSEIEIVSMRKELEVEDD